VHVRIVTGGRTFALAAHVLRCVVWSLDGEEGVTYRGALQFEHPCLSFRESGTCTEPEPNGEDDLARTPLREAATDGEYSVPVQDLAAADTPGRRYPETI
jgi:hypothetical protein